MPAPKGNQYAKGNKGGGRKTKYDPKFCELVERMVMRGMTDAEIAEIIGVHESTLNDWKHEHEEFSRAMKLGDDIATDMVERSLFRGDWLREESSEVDTEWESGPAG
jgi:transposase-like protein